MRRGVVRDLQCCCCGAAAGRWEQHWNRDNGYGICRRCVDWLMTKHGAGAADIKSNYGIEGINYARLNS